MKKIVSFIFISFLILLIPLVYFNIDTITDYTIKFFTKNMPLVIEDSNDYRRDYNFKRFMYLDDYKPMNKDDLENIYFNILNNGWDTFTFYCPDEYERCLDDIRVMSNDTTLISKINNYVSPYNSFAYLDTSIDEYGTITLTVHKSYTQNEIELLNEKVKEVIEQLELKENEVENNLRKIKYYLVNNITYDDDFLGGDVKSPSTKATGALFDGKAVCSGYSDAMALFLDKLGIPNIKVSTENHIWNLVYINDKWNHIDITWSDTDNEHDLKDKFFLISTEKLIEIDKKEHNFDTTFFIEAK